MGWMEVLFGGGAITAAIGLIKFLINRYDKSHDPKKLIIKELKRRAMIGPIIKRMVYDSDAERAAVCVAKNGGMQPNPSCQLYSSVCPNEWDYREGAGDMSGEWENQPLTAWYMNGLVELHKRGTYSIFTKEIPEGEPLRYVFEANGVKRVRLYDIYATDGAYYYLPVHFKSEDKLNARQENALRVGVMGIRNAYRNYFEES